MSESTDPRKLAAKVAKGLVDKKGQPDQAVLLLAAWATVGGNDSEGQQLLAEALRIDPSSRVAQMAFNRMEGMEGDHRELDEAIAYFDEATLSRLNREIFGNVFRRAQMGFNNNIKAKGQQFHVQTEDSGLNQPHIITHLFADGGRVIKSHKRSYAEHVDRSDVAEFVRGLMKAQHLEMVLQLREGRFDEILAGRAVGGMELLTEPPNVDIKKLAERKAQKKTAEEATAEPPKAAAVRHFGLRVMRSLTGGPERYDPAGDIAIIGTEGEVSLPGEVFCAPKEAQLIWREPTEGDPNSAHLILEDIEGGNGIFLRIRGVVELEVGDEFVVGDQLLRVERNPLADDGPDPDPTYFYSSPKWPSSFRVVQVFEGGAVGACVVARGNTLQVGSAIGDLVFPEDPLVNEQHCVIEEQAGTVVLTDLDSRTGVFVRIRGEQVLNHGDEILVGRTRLVVDLKSAEAA